MRRDDPETDLATLEAEHRELAGEADALRRFITCMRRLTETTGSRHLESKVYLLLEQVLDAAISAVNARDGSMLVPDRRTRELVFVMVRGEAAHTQLVGHRLPPGEGIAGWVAHNRRAVIVNNVAADERFYPGVDKALAYRTQSVLAAPLIGGDRLLGVVELVNKRDRRLFSVGNQKLLSLMCRFSGELLASLAQGVDLNEAGTLIHARRARAGESPAPP